MNSSACLQIPHRRGAALLIVLTVLVLTVTACAILAQSAATTQLQRNVDSCGRAADLLLVAAEDPIQDWLDSKSAKAVVDPDSDQPRVAVLHDRWRLDDRDCELTITAWDQCGMVPWDLVRNASPLRLLASAEALARFDQLNAESANAVSSHGLDLLVDPAGDATQSLFPSAAPSEAPAILFAGAQSNEPAREERSPSATASDVVGGVPVGGPVGGILATHNRGAAINVNTAPIPLVEAAMRLAGREAAGGIAQIVAARRQGKPASAGTATVAGAPPPDGAPRPTITSSSNSWSFRIDIRVESVRRSWWAVYQPASGRQKTNHRPSKTANHAWECVQRLAVTR